MFKKKKKEIKPKLKMEIVDKESKSLDKKEPKLSNQEIVDAYKNMHDDFSLLIEKNYILEWKVFGSQYKGKYISLQIDDELFIFGEDKTTVQYIKAKTVKEAYLKYIKDDNN